MKIRILISFLYMLLWQVSQGQVTFQNLALQNPDSNIIYIGIVNQIKISGVTDFSKTRVTVTRATIGSSNKGVFDIRATTLGISRIIVHEQSLFSGSKEFIVKRIPDPKAQLGAFRDTTLSILEIIENKTLIIVLPDCIARYRFNVVRFNTTIISGSDTLYNGIKIEGNSLSNDLVKIIENLKSGDKLLFDNIYIQGPDDTRIDPFYIVVK